MSALQQSNIGERDSNMELLRLVLMYLIVVQHGIVYGLDLIGLQSFRVILQERDLIPACLLNSLFLISVNTFILISGFFSIKVSKSKFIRLISQLFVCTLLFTSAFFLIKGENKSSLISLLLISHSRYWFVVCYLLLMVIAPAINLFFNSFPPDKQRLFVLALLFISCYLGFLWHFEANVNGFTVFQFITLYSVGMYIRKNDIRLKTPLAIAIYLLCSIALTAIMFEFHKNGRDSWAWIMTYYNNPILVVSATAFFFIFKNLKIQNKKINRFASSSLIIYLFSCSALIEYYYYPLIQSIYESHGRIAFVLIPAIALIITSLAIILDKLIISKIINYFHQSLMSVKLSWLHI